MGYLTDKTTYLAGNIHSTSNNDYGVGWRDKITPIVEDRFKVKVINPCKDGEGDSKQDQLYFRQLIKERKFVELKEEFYKVIRKDLKAVDKADFIIFYHNPKIPTIGTIHEVINAANQKKPVLIVCDEDNIDHLNPWLLTIIKPQWLFTTWDAMIEYLDGVNNGKIETSHWW